MSRERGWRLASSREAAGQRRAAPPRCGLVLEKALAASLLLALLPGALAIVQGPGHWQEGCSGSLASGRKALRE